MKKELTKKILWTIGLGTLIAVGIWFFIVQMQFIIRNFINNPMSGRFVGDYYKDWVLSIVGQVFRILFIVFSLVVLSLNIFKIWENK